MVGDTDMDFEFSTEVVTLWPWQYHQYEPPGCANHTHMYYCSASNRCESCRAQVFPQGETTRETSVPNSGEINEEILLEMSESNMCGKQGESKCRVYSKQSCYICSTVTDQLVSIIRWVNDGDLQDPNLEVEDTKYFPLSSSSSEHASQSISHASFSSCSSDPDRGDSLLCVSRSQNWGNNLSESASMSSGIDMETDVQGFGLGTTNQPVKREHDQETCNSSFKTSSGQCSFSEWYPAPPKSYPHSSASAHTSLSLGMHNATQLYPQFESEMYPKEQLVNPMVSEHYFVPQSRQVFIPVTTYLPNVPWNQVSMPPRPLANYIGENKPLECHLNPNESYSYRRPYGTNPEHDEIIQSENTMNELTYLFNKDCTIANRKSSSAPAGSPALLSPRRYFQWESHEFPPPCSTISSNTLSSSANCFFPTAPSTFADNPEMSRKIPTTIAFSSVVKSSKPEPQHRNSRTSTVSNPSHGVMRWKEGSRGNKSTKSSTRSSNTSNSSNNVSRASSRPGKQVTVKVNRDDLCSTKNTSMSIKQRPFLLRSALPPKRTPEEMPLIGGPLQAKYSFMPKTVTISPLSKEDKVNSVLRCTVKEPASKESPKQPEHEVSSKSAATEKVSSNKGTSKNNEESKPDKKTKIKKGKGKKNGPAEKAKESLETKSSKSEESQAKNAPLNANATGSNSKRKHACSANSVSRRFPLKLRELNPDVRTPRSVRLRALHACRMNLNSIDGGEVSDSDAASNSTVELSFEEASLSLDEGTGFSGPKNKSQKSDGDESFHRVERRRVKRKKKNLDENNGRANDATRDMGCQTSK